MRDGIPDSLPVPRKWKTFIKCADRPADRGTDRPVACLRDAIQDDLRRQFPKGPRDELTRVVVEAEGYLPGFQIAGMSIRDHIPDRHGLAEVIGEVRTNVEGGNTPHAALLDVVTERIEALTAARRRQIIEDLAGKVPASELKGLVSEFDRSIECVNFRSEVTQFIEESSAPAKSARKPIEADEDLRGQP